MSGHGNGRDKENPVLAERVTTASADRTRSAIERILRPEPEKPSRHVVTPATRAAVGGRIESAKARSRREARMEGQAARDSSPTRGLRRRASGGRGQNPTRSAAHRLTPAERRAQMLEQTRARPARGEFKGQWKADRQHGKPGEHAYQETKVQPNLRTKPETATERAIREGLTREKTGATHSTIAPARGLATRTTLLPAERESYKWLRANADRLQAQVDEHTQLEAQARATLANPRASAADKFEAQQDIPYARTMAHAAQANLQYLQHLTDKQNAGKIAAKAAREARLAPLRAHLSGLKGAKTPEAVEQWLAQKYPHAFVDLSTPGQNSRGKPTQLGGGLARRIAATYATLAREFPSAAAHVSGVRLNPHSETLLHSAGEGMVLGAPWLRRGGVKNAQVVSGQGGGSGKPLAPEALVRSGFAPGVERDLQALAPDSAGGKAYAKWRASYPSADFARSFTAIAYGRGGKGQRGAGRSPEVRALKRALTAAYPSANLTQKPIRPTE